MLFWQAFFLVAHVKSPFQLSFWINDEYDAILILKITFICLIESVGKPLLKIAIEKSIVHYITSNWNRWSVLKAYGSDFTIEYFNSFWMIVLDSLISCRLLQEGTKKCFVNFRFRMIEGVLLRFFFSLHFKLNELEWMTEADPKTEFVKKVNGNS